MGNSLVNIDLSTLDIPLGWINFTIRDQGGVEFVEINAEPRRFVVIVDRKMGDNVIST